MNLDELLWVGLARSLIGLKEDTSKTKHNPTILAMLKDMGKYSKENKAWWAEDETPWCGLFVGWCLGESERYVIKEWYRASAWDNPAFMTKLSKPCYGCIVTFTRNGGGHVGFVVGEDKQGNLMVLGGNQSNAVNIMPFNKSRVTGYYFPSKWINSQCVKFVPLDNRYNLPKLLSNGKVSSNEV